MAFFDDMVKKTRNMADSSKLSSQITEEERNIESYYRDLGKQYFDRYKDEEGCELRGLVDNILASQEKIRQYNEQIDQLKGVQKCPGCGMEMPADSMFCNACGTKMPPKPVSVNQPVCANCGAVLKEGQRFCVQCGTPYEAPAPAVKFCPECGKQLPGDAGFCPDCGAAV